MGELLWVLSFALTRSRKIFFCDCALVFIIFCPKCSANTEQKGSLYMKSLRKADSIQLKFITVKEDSQVT